MTASDLSKLQRHSVLIAFQASPLDKSMPIQKITGLLVLVLGALLLAACGGSESTQVPGRTSTSEPTETTSLLPSPTSSPDDIGATETPAEPISGLPSNTVGLYLGVNLGSETDYLHEYDIVLESATKAIMLYIPESSELVIIDTYTSPSYARSTKRPYSVDDRLFITREWSSGSLDIEELDPRTGGIATSARNLGNSLYAIVGDIAYSCKVTERFGSDDYRLMRYNLAVSGSQGNAILETCNIDLYSDDGELYAIRTKEDDLTRGSLPIDIFHWNESTLEFDFVNTLLLPNYSEYSCCEFAVDGAKVYAAGLKSAASQVEIWEYEFVDDTEPSAGISAAVGGGIVGLFDMDADDGHFAIHLQGVGPPLLLLDLLSGSYELVDPGVGFFDVQILFLED